MTSSKIGMGILEVLAILFNLGFTVLYIQQSEWAFILGMLGPSLLAILSYRRQLYADVLLQIFYILITLFGWLHLGGNWPSMSISLSTHILTIGIMLTIGWGIGNWLQAKTNAAMPILDSCITTLSILATFYMMIGCHENWMYFMVINAACAYLFFTRKLVGISILYFLYLILAIEGYFRFGWIPI
jgi:nicotinamide mononucleotide transporter